MAFTHDELNALERALSLGLKEVQFKDGKQVFMSLKEMRSLRAQMRRELGLQPERQIIRGKKASFSKGIR